MKKIHNSFFTAFMKITSIKFMKSLILIIVMCFVISFPAFPADHTSINALQNITVTGTVTDSDGSQLPGVSIVVKGTTIGVITDFKGNYVLKVPSVESILVYSLVVTMHE